MPRRFNKNFSRVEDSAVAGPKGIDVREEDYARLAAKIVADESYNWGNWGPSAPWTSIARQYVVAHSTYGVSLDSLKLAEALRVYFFEKLENDLLAKADPLAFSKKFVQESVEHEMKLLVEVSSFNIGDTVITSDNRTGKVKKIEGGQVLLAMYDSDEDAWFDSDDVFVSTGRPSMEPKPKTQFINSPTDARKAMVK